MHIREMRVSYGKRLPVEGQTLSLRNARDIVAVMAPVLEQEVVEVCYALFLTTRTGLIRYHQVSRGAISTTIVHPREILQAALLANAARLVFAHYVARNIMRLMCPESLCGRGQWEPPITPVDTLIAAT